jgi:hypothetical protein
VSHYVYLGAYFMAVFPKKRVAQPHRYCPTCPSYGSVYTSFCGTCGSKIQIKEAESFESIPSYQIVKTRLKVGYAGEGAEVLGTPPDRKNYQKHYWAPFDTGEYDEVAIVSMSADQELATPADDVIPFTQVDKLLVTYEKDFKKLTEAYAPFGGKVSAGWGLLVFDRD